MCIYFIATVKKVQLFRYSPTFSGTPCTLYGTGNSRCNRCGDVIKSTSDVVIRRMQKHGAIVAATAVAATIAATVSSAIFIGAWWLTNLV